MATLTKASDIDLTPIPGKQYFNLEREWREEFIYFLMVDRFHDSNVRSPVLQAGRSNGISTPNDFFGGTIKGITNHLDYIAGLGCTAIWISPIFENNPKAYHGYDINNYLGVDLHFGTEQDLIDLVDAAHNFKKRGQPFPMRIIFLMWSSIIRGQLGVPRRTEDLFQCATVRVRQLPEGGSAGSH